MCYSSSVSSCEWIDVEDKDLLVMEFLLQLNYCHYLAVKFMIVASEDMKTVIILAPQDPGGKRKKPGGARMEAPMASAGARAYNGGLGAVPPAGSRDRAPGQGVRGAKPPEAESFLAFGHPTKATKCAY